MVVAVGGRRGRGGAAGGLGPLLGLLGPGGILDGSWEVAAASWNELELDSHWMLEYEERLLWFVGPSEFFSSGRGAKSSDTHRSRFPPFRAT